MSVKPTYFVPVCLYPHTKYRTKAGVSALFRNYRLDEHDYLIVVADRLLALDRLVTGRYWSLNGVFTKARRDAQQVFRLIKRTAAECGAEKRGRVVYWDEIATRKEFGEFANRLQDVIMTDETISKTIEDFVNCRVRRFGSGAAPTRERDSEREYLLSEVCMSVYCTEILDYQVEIWERPPAPEVPDPLKILYNGSQHLVVAATGRPVKRSLKFLYDGL
jgi:hypothetical protein